MNPDTWPELSDWELNSWALLTVPDLENLTSMGAQNLSSSQTQTFAQANFYDTSSLVSGNFQQQDLNERSLEPTPNSNSNPTSNQNSNPSSSRQPTSGSGRNSIPTSKTSPTSSSSPTSPNSKIHKRTLNTLAARRYRQKRVDQMAELEQKLRESEREKEEALMRVARLEGEVEVLRGLVRGK
ncbi:hypothetical protein L207DRAFT_519680 [Hyaloscypha variabilis F]|uniref:BZIP domain-containing protein n=1 Tax=Hyaloscypha variabilis (strain UAMH 11265 / GT02V1 / F) TaxID=1149755 RepID=A0A2J6QXL6_HYAVF|nr:hypothetical protein L207DRAFT_519680 [Hyaloscypha variabilis F]